MVHGQICYAADQVLEVCVEEDYGLHAYLEILDRDRLLLDEQARLARLPQTAYRQASANRLAPLTIASGISIPLTCAIEWSLRYERQQAAMEHRAYAVRNSLRQKLRSKLSSSLFRWRKFWPKLALPVERLLRRILGRHYPELRLKSSPKHDCSLTDCATLIQCDEARLPKWLGALSANAPMVKRLTTGLPTAGLRVPVFSAYTAVASASPSAAIVADQPERAFRAETLDALFRMRVSRIATTNNKGIVKNIYENKSLETLNEYPSEVTVSEWPRISIVTVSFNQVKYLPECLDSIILQDYPHLEYIVIDGGSTDGSRDILNNYREKISTLIIEPDRGQSHALNKAFALASGEVMNWVCSDDRLEPGALGVVAETFRRCPSDLVVGGCRVIDEQSKTKSVHHSAFITGATSPLSFGDLCSFTATWQKALYFYQPEVFFTRDLWRRSGAHVKEHLHYAMDYELFLRFALAGAKVFATRKILGCSRQHSEQKTQHELPLYLPTVSRILRDFRDDLAALRPELCTSK
jgi:hypothetical protein